MIATPPMYCAAALGFIFFTNVLAAYGILNSGWRWVFYVHIPQPNVYSSGCYPSVWQKLRRCIYPICPAPTWTGWLIAVVRSVVGLKIVQRTLLCCDEYHNCRVYIFSSLRFAGKLHTTAADVIFLTGAIHPPRVMFRCVRRFCHNSRLSRRF